MKDYSYSLTSIQWRKIGVGALIAVGGALATYASSVIANIDWTSFGPWAPLATALASILINFLRKYIPNEKN